MDPFQNKNLLPMLISAQDQNAFDSEDYIFELKLDGTRAMLYLDQNYTDIKNKRLVNLNSSFPELRHIHQYVKKRCILCGEIIVMQNNKPDFNALQRRSHLRNSFKIDWLKKHLSATFVAFDMVYVDKEFIHDCPLMERKERMKENIQTENSYFSAISFIERYGIDFFHLAKKNDLEGIVAKRKKSPYVFGKRTKDWIKIKNMLDADFYILGYAAQNEQLSLLLGVKDKNEYRFVSHVAIPKNHADIPLIRSLQKIPPMHHFALADQHKYTFVEPRLKATVKFINYTASGGLRQAVYKGVRFD